MTHPSPAGAGFGVSSQSPEFWLAFLKTPGLRDNPTMRRICERLSERPWLTRLPSFEQEKSHFYSWLADTYLPWPRSKTAQGDAISDMTAYHEWLHMLTLPRGYADPLDWMTAIRANESQVSIETEILARQRLPGMQEIAFSGCDLWVDRIALGKEPLLRSRPQDQERMERAMTLMSQPSRERDLYAKTEGRFLLSESPDEQFWGFTHRELWALRRGVALWPNPQDPVEAQLGLYESLSDAWLLRWAGPAQRIEPRREALMRACELGEGDSAILEFKAWMEAQNGPHGIPFEELALDGLPARPMPEALLPPAARSRPKA